MEIENQVNLQFTDFKVFDVLYKASQPPHKEIPIDFKISPGIAYPTEDKNEFQIIVQVELKAEAVFVFNFTSLGTFKLSADLEEGLKKQFTHVNATIQNLPLAPILGMSH